MVKVLSIKDSVGIQLERIKKEMQAEENNSVSYSRLLMRLMKKAGMWHKVKKVDED